MTSLWHFSGNVVANSNWSCLSIQSSLKSAARWSSRFNKMHEDLHALHVSLNNASTRTVRKWLTGNNGHLITVQSWVSWNYCVWRVIHKAILKPSSGTDWCMVCVCVWCQCGEFGYIRWAASWWPADAVPQVRTSTDVQWRPCQGGLYTADNHVAMWVRSGQIWWAAVNECKLALVNIIKSPGALVAVWL